MLDLPYQRWRNPRRQTFEEVKQKRDRMVERWAPFDWTEVVRERLQQQQNDADEAPTTPNMEGSSSSVGMEDVADQKQQPAEELTKTDKVKRWKKPGLT